MRNRLAAALRVFIFKKVRVSAAHRALTHRRAAQPLVYVRLYARSFLMAFSRTFLSSFGGHLLHCDWGRPPTTIAPDFRTRVPGCGHGCRSLGRTEIRDGGARECLRGVWRIWQASPPRWKRLEPFHLAYAEHRGDACSNCACQETFGKRHLDVQLRHLGWRLRVPGRSRYSSNCQRG